MATDASVKINPDTKEGIGEVHDYFTIDSPDTDLVRMIDRKLQAASSTHEKLKKEGKLNEDYWNREHLKTISLRWHNSRIIQNVVYTGVETMVPIITSKPAEPMISIADDVEEDAEGSKDFTDSLSKVLLDKYGHPDYPQQELFEMLARHLLLYKIGIPKIIWDESIDDYNIEYVHPHKIILGSDGHYNHDVWVAQYLEKTLNEICEMFPEKENDIYANLFPGATGDIKQQFGDTPIGFWEYWPEDGKFVVWKMNDVILQKKLNPYMNWTEDKKFDKLKNHFDYSHKPFMFLNSQNLGRHVWDDTTPVSQVLPIQDGINLMQRIITDTARDQGILVGAQEMIDRDELYKYTGAPDDKLSVKGGDPTKAIHRVEPKQLAAFVQQNLEHLLRMADNIMGTHATTRGEKSGNQTLGQDQMAKEADYGRIDAIVRGIERLATEIYNWEVQMMFIKYKAEHFARVLGQTKGEKFFGQMQSYNARGIKILVKPGSTLPTDKVSQRAEAMELAGMNKIADLDLYKRMDFPNPMEMAKNLYMQTAAPQLLYPDIAEQVAASQPPPPAVDPNAQIVPPPMGGVPPNIGGMPPVANMPQVPQPMPMQQPMPEALPQAPMQTMENIETNEEIPIASDPNVPMEIATSFEEPVETGMLGETEHTQLILAGSEVAPFEGIDPVMFEDHVNREFAFIASDEFLQLPNEIQVLYSQHVLAEREALQTEDEMTEDQYGNV